MAKKLSAKDRREAQKNLRMQKVQEKAAEKAEKQAEEREKSILLTGKSEAVTVSQVENRRASAMARLNKIEKLDLSGFDVEIYCHSHIHLGTGQADVNVDAEVVHDELGLPYFPGKRFRGLLRESALEVQEMFKACGKNDYSTEFVNDLFCKGEQTGIQLMVPDFHLAQADELEPALRYLEKKYGELFRPKDVLDTYTSLRYQTSIDKSTYTAKETSLHNMRVVKAGQTFCGHVALENGRAEHFIFLALALRNLSRAGLKRNRGFGQIECTMLQAGKEIGTMLLKKGLMDSSEKGGKQ